MTVSHRNPRNSLARRFGRLISWAALTSSLYAAGPLVVLIGPPGSGKSTQAEILKKERGMAIISADDLIARNQSKFQRFKNPSIQGIEPRLDAALNGLVEEALSNTDLSKGVVIDGYPAAKAQGDHLAKLRQNLELSKAVVIHLMVPDEVVRKRLAKQKRPDLEQQLKDYHRELDFAKEYFPEADIRVVDGTKKASAVAKEIRKLLKN